MMIIDTGGCVSSAAQFCDYVGSGAVCELDPEEGMVEPEAKPPLIELEDDQDPYCPQGWKSFQGSCYKVLNTKGDFYSAILACQKEAGILAVIHGTEEKVS